MLGSGQIDLSHLLLHHDEAFLRGGQFFCGGLRQRRLLASLFFAVVALITRDNALSNNKAVSCAFLRALDHAACAKGQIAPGAADVEHCQVIKQAALFLGFQVGHFGFSALLGQFAGVDVQQRRRRPSPVDYAESVFCHHAIKWRGQLNHTGGLHHPTSASC